MRVLDVRTIPPPKRHPEIFGLFQSLPAGEAFVLVNDHYPKPLLYQFQAECSGCFDWNVLQNGPELFRVEIRKRDVTSSRNVTECLQTDHRRLDGIMANITSLVGKNAFSDAGDRFAEFCCGLNRHIDIEEKVLFPVFERMTGMSQGGPTAAMRHEHVEIRRILDEISAAIGSSNAAEFRSARERLLSVLHAHNMKEEHILYPSTDQECSDDRARDDLVKKMQAF